MKRGIILFAVLLVLTVLAGCISPNENTDILGKDTETIRPDCVTYKINCIAETTQPPKYDVIPDTTAINGTEYVLNTNSMKFHYSTCGSGKLISEKNIKCYFGAREDLIRIGYSPCGNCDP